MCVCVCMQEGLKNWFFAQFHKSIQKMTGDFDCNAGKIDQTRKKQVNAKRMHFDWVDVRFWSIGLMTWLVKKFNIESLGQRLHTNGNGSAVLRSEVGLKTQLNQTNYNCFKNRLCRQMCVCCRVHERTHAHAHAQMTEKGRVFTFIFIRSEMYIWMKKRVAHGMT